MDEIVIGYTTGVFDMFHVGHLRLLKKAKENCDYLIVGVSSDELVKQYKNKTPVIPLADRMEIISAIKYVDEVVVQKDRDKLAAHSELNFQVMFVGDDWKGNPLWTQLEQDLQKRGAHIKYFEYTKNVSSSQFRKILSELEFTLDA